MQTYTVWVKPYQDKDWKPFRQHCTLQEAYRAWDNQSHCGAFAIDIRITDTGECMDYLGERMGDWK